MGLFPKMLGGFQRIDLTVFPPSLFIPDLMKLPMVPAAQRDCELIADLKTDGPRLRKTQMMRIGGLPSADQTWLRSDEFQVGLVAQSLGFGDGELAFVDFARNQVCRRQRRWWRNYCGSLQICADAI
jgi:hypothetical protein